MHSEPQTTPIRHSGCADKKRRMYLLTYEIKRFVVVKEQLEWRSIGVQNVAGCIVRTVESPASP